MHRQRTAIRLPSLVHRGPLLRTAPRTGRYPRRTRTGLFASAPTPPPVHCCAAHAALRVLGLLVAAGPVAFVSLWPRGTLGVLLPTSQLLSPKLRSKRLGPNHTHTRAILVVGQSHWCD